MIKLNTNTFFIFHALSILLFAIIYYYLMINFNEHFILNNSKLDKNKIVNCLYYSASIQSTNGLSDILPTSLLARSITLCQYLSTLFITIGCFTFL